MADLDPIQYEMFRHRLFNILEEGRIAIQKVSGSPVVVEGGECMCSFYTSGGTVILTAAGLLLHCTGAQDAIRKAVEWYEDDPGINEGDQFFFNDPYIAATHACDMIVAKPIFYNGKRIAWTAAMMHTDDTGGHGAGGQKATATDVYDEGIRILGLKIVEAGKFRPEVFRTIVEQVRDPHLVGLDAKAKIAANNVCAKSYLELIKKFGFEFVEAASQKVISDSEKMARAKLISLPDGVWRSRMYSYSDDHPWEVICTMTKDRDEITFDFTGSSPQVAGSLNSTLPDSWSSLFCVLAGQLFWNVPWNGGMVAPVKLICPEGTVVNCNFPAACSNGVIGGGWLITSTAKECIVKMLYAGGLWEDVSGGWNGIPGGNIRAYSGKNQHGSQVGAVIFDHFASGCGGAPHHDGEDSGGGLMNPQSCISDCEIVEMNYPFVYLARNHERDSGGFGKHPGGMAPERLLMVWGSDTLTIGHYGFGGVKGNPAEHGIFGGYPHGLMESILVKTKDFGDMLHSQAIYPTTFEDAAMAPGEVYAPGSESFDGLPIKVYDIICDRLGPGCGYGDPLDREAEKVVQDIERGAVSAHNAERMYGVILDPGTGRLDQEATQRRRREMWEERLRATKLSAR